MCVFTVRTAQAEPDHRTSAEQARVSIALELVDCTAPAAADVRALAALELRGRLVDGPDAVADQHVVVRCAGDHAELRTTERDEVRTIDLGSVPPPLRARLLALSIAELSPVPRSEPPSAQPSPDVDAKPLRAPPLAPPTIEPRRGSAQARSFGFVAVGARLSAAPIWSAAGALSALQPVVGPLAWTGELALGQARRDIDGGRLRVRSLVLRTGPALTLRSSFARARTERFDRARALWYAGLAARVELLELAGQPRDRSLWRGARSRTFVAGPALFVGLALPLGRHLCLGLEAELAHQLRAVDAEVQGGRTRTLSPWRAALDALVGATW